jgi:hypothetical protein
MDSFGARLVEAVRHHARLTDAGDDPIAVLAHARRLRDSVGIKPRPEMDELIAGLEADVERDRYALTPMWRRMPVIAFRKAAGAVWAE